MEEERHALMTHSWPELRRFCREREVELVEVDLRWGISEEQSTRKETLKLCLDEIRACRPFFVGLLGERYGWIPDDEAFTPDLLDQQPWLYKSRGKSVTELEILHGVLNNPEMAGKAFFYFRDPKYIDTLDSDKKFNYISETHQLAEKQRNLKDAIRKTCSEKHISLLENYKDPHSIALLVLEQLKDAIAQIYPKEGIPDPLTKEACNHEAFAMARRKTYIGRPYYYSVLEAYCDHGGKPVLLLGDSGSGKSALIANWVEHRRKTHPDDFIFTHYIGGTPDSSDHIKLILRLMKEIKKWTNDSTDLPKNEQEAKRDIGLWLSKARSSAEHKKVKAIVIFDAINQLEDREHSKQLGWLPIELFKNSLKLILSTLPNETNNAIVKYGVEVLRIEPLTIDERIIFIQQYLNRYGKKLDEKKLLNIAKSTQSSNPMFLILLLDELRISAVHDTIDKKLTEYLRSDDISALLKKIFLRYQSDYERDRVDLVKDTLRFIYGAKEGLAEYELLELLGEEGQNQLPFSLWSPIRAALEGMLVEKSGIYNFSHQYIRQAVEDLFLPDIDCKDDTRIILAEYFEKAANTRRTSSELMWLLCETEQYQKLKNVLLDIDRFMVTDEEEIYLYWQRIGPSDVGIMYKKSWEEWRNKNEISDIDLFAAKLGLFLANRGFSDEGFFFISLGFNHAIKHPGPKLDNIIKWLTLYSMFIPPEESEKLLSDALKLITKSSTRDDHRVNNIYFNLASTKIQNGEYYEAEQLLMKLEGFYQNENLDLNNFSLAINLAIVYNNTGRQLEGIYLLEKVIQIHESNYGPQLWELFKAYLELGSLYQNLCNYQKAEYALSRATEIAAESLGLCSELSRVAMKAYASLLYTTNQYAKAEPVQSKIVEMDHQRSKRNQLQTVIDLLEDSVVLANINIQLGEYQKALGYLQKNIEIYNENMGLEEQVILPTLTYYGLLLYGLKEVKDARAVLESVIRIIDQYGVTIDLSHGDPFTSLAMIYSDENRFVEAEKCFNASIQLIEKQQESFRPNLGDPFANLALLYMKVSKMELADQLFLRSMKLIKKAEGDYTSELLFTLLNYSVLLLNMNRLNDASCTINEGLNLLVNDDVETEGVRALFLKTLAQIKINENDFPTSFTSICSAIKIHEKDIPSSANYLWSDLIVLYQLYAKKEEYANADSTLKRMVDLYEIYKYGSYDQYLEVLIEQSNLFCIQSNYEKAEQILTSTLAVAIREPKVSPTVLSRIYDRLGYVSFNKGDFNKAEQYSWKSLGIFVEYCRNTGEQKAEIGVRVKNYVLTSKRLGLDDAVIKQRIRTLLPELTKL